MEHIEAEASQFLTDLLTRVTGLTLDAEQRSTVFRIACTLPERSTISDLAEACSPENATRLDIPAARVAALQPLVSTLQAHAGQPAFALSVFDARKVDDSLCPRCRVPLTHGKAFEVMRVTFPGPATLRACRKCPACGYSEAGSDT